MKLSDVTTQMHTCIACGISWECGLRGCFEGELTECGKCKCGLPECGLMEKIDDISMG